MYLFTMTSTYILVVYFGCVYLCVVWFAFNIWSLYFYVATRWPPNYEHLQHRTVCKWAAETAVSSGGCS